MLAFAHLGTIQATLTIATWEHPTVGRLALECWRWIKLNGKADRPTALPFHKGCSNRRALPGRHDRTRKTQSLARPSQKCVLRTPDKTPSNKPRSIAEAIKMWRKYASRPHRAKRDLIGSPLDHRIAMANSSPISTSQRHLAGTSPRGSYVFQINLRDVTQISTSAAEYRIPAA